MNHPIALPAAADDLDPRIALLQSELLDPSTDRPRWMACHQQVVTLRRMQQLRASIAAAYDHLEQPYLRRRVACWLKELRRLEESA